MEFEIYQIDSFAAKPFKGNPAAVVPLPTSEWPSDELLQKIALENNLSETAFYTPPTDDGLSHLRWFTPTTEVELCGHATLAAAAIVYHRGYTGSDVKFQTRARGILIVSKVDKNKYVMDFPETKTIAGDVTAQVPDSIVEALGLTVDNVEDRYLTEDKVVVVKDGSIIDTLRPDLKTLAAVKARLIIVTGRGTEHDFKSRVFGPGVGVDEDPVTGSAHTHLAPYWSAKLGKSTVTASQGNPATRVGELVCTVKGDGRVEIAGSAVLYLQGKIFVEL